MSNSKYSFVFSIFFPVICIGAFAFSSLAQSKLASNSETNNNSYTQQNALDTQNKAESFSKNWSRESLQNAVILFLNAAKQWEKLKINKNAIFCLRRVAALQQILGDRKQAHLTYIQGLKLADQAKLNDEKLRLLSQLAFFHFLEGNFEKGNKLLAQAQILEKNVTDDSARAEMLVSLAEFNLYKRNLGKSVALYKEALICWQKTNDISGEAQSLLNLGYVYMAQGEYAVGLRTLEDALFRWKTAGDKRGEALTYIAIGHIYTATDDKKFAFDAYQKAEQFFPEDLDFNERAFINNGLASIYEDYSEWNLAFNYRKKALNLFQKVNDLYGQLATLSYIGPVSHFVGDDDLAFEYFRLAENIAIKLNDYHSLSRIKVGTGNLYFEVGSYQKALKLYKQALKYFQKTSNSREMAIIAEKLGQIYVIQKNHKLARINFLTAVNLHRRVKDKFAETQTLYHLATLDEIENKNEDALKYIKESLDLTENLYSDVLNSKLKSTYFSNVFERYELYINLLMKIHKQNPNENYAIQALQAAEKSRARSMLENLSHLEANFTKDADAETVKREKEIRSLLNLKSDKLTDHLSHNADKAEIKKISLEINELEHELEEIKAHLKQSSPVYSAIKNPAPFDVAELQNEFLDENSLLLEFSFGKEESYLWLIAKNEVVSYVLPPREQIETRIENLRELLVARGMKKDEAFVEYQKRITEAEDNYQLEARSLSIMLFGQIADKITNKRLIIVPDGKLHYFPVSALPSPNSDRNEPILLTNETIYEPSAQTLSLLAKSSDQISQTAKNLLVFSDPVFSGDDSRVSATNKAVENVNTETAKTEKFRFVESLNSLSRLTASKEESDSIINIVGGSNSDVFSGFSANREQFLNAGVSDYKVIHFATHGLINEQRPELSGIVLSRFDEKGQKMNEFVRLQDIYGLNLSADLVVLSACSTGIGKEVKGEGLMSLNNAFLQTGAKSVVSSLWKVDDYATLELMKNFYGVLAREKVTPAQALREAQISLRQNPLYQSPFYWAAFTIQGDYRRIPNISNRFDYLPYLLIIFLPVTLFGFYQLFGLLRKKAKSFNREGVNY